MKWKLEIAAVILIILALAFGVLAYTENEHTFGGKELHSPSDWISQEEIHVFDDHVVLEVEDPIWARFTNTNSMDPFIDETSHAIEISPKDPSTISVGDVISYETGSKVLIHRVIETGYDKEGSYYIVKGDNNTFRDAGKVRFEKVRGVVVAVIY